MSSKKVGSPQAAPVQPKLEKTADKPAAKQSVARDGAPAKAPNNPVRDARVSKAETTRKPAEAKTTDAATPRRSGFDTKAPTELPSRKTTPEDAHAYGRAQANAQSGVFDLGDPPNQALSKLLKNPDFATAYRAAGSTISGEEFKGLLHKSKMDLNAFVNEVVLGGGDMSQRLSSGAFKVVLNAIREGQTVVPADPAKELARAKTVSEAASSAPIVRPNVINNTNVGTLLGQQPEGFTFGPTIDENTPPPDGDGLPPQLAWGANSKALFAKNPQLAMQCNINSRSPAISPADMTEIVKSAGPDLQAFFKDVVYGDGGMAARLTPGAAQVLAAAVAGAGQMPQGGPNGFETLTQRPWEGAQPWNGPAATATDYNGFLRDDGFNFLHRAVGGVLTGAIAAAMMGVVGGNQGNFFNSVMYPGSSMYDMMSPMAGWNIGTSCWGLDPFNSLAGGLSLGSLWGATNLFDPFANSWGMGSWGFDPFNNLGGWWR